MSQPRIAVLNATHQDENTTRNFRRELDASLSEFDVTDGTVPDDFEYDGVVVTGSRASVYWNEEWIRATKEWVGDAIDRGIPCFGICWGHQLLADVLGGTVEDMGVYEVGYSDIGRLADAGSRLLDGISESFTAFTSHSDAVTELPPGAEPLAQNEYSNHGFRKDRVFGVQFHPEYDTKTARDLVHRKELSDERLESVLGEITQENYREACEAKLVFENFLAFVREVDAHTVTAEVDASAGAATDAGCSD
ncbi:type 1 glutamine amidotransferase [Natrialbaceae archaeon A-arb3/5]